MKTERCVIISASPSFSGHDEITGEDFVIACDGGYSHALSNGIKPDYLVGDFDSYDGRIADDIPVLRAEVDKDDTDTMLAVRLAFSMGYKNFLLLGAVGGRFDHTYANLSVAMYIAEHGGHCKIVDEGMTAYTLKDGKITLQAREPTDIISVFSLTEISKGIFYSGLKYDLQDAVLKSSFPLGISNRFMSSEATIAVREGILLIMVVPGD